MSNQNIPSAEGVNEFIVHAKHTCDSCYNRPIVGKRYTSSTVSDFDLCAKCYEECDDEKKADLSEILLARDKATKNSFILKLKIEAKGEEAQTRRINVTDLWDSSISQLSFKKLIDIAQKFASAGVDGQDVDQESSKSSLAKFTVTYIDEDGDKINISSNQELMDSFLQTVKKKPARPFRITVTTASNADMRSIGKAKVTGPTLMLNKPSVAPLIIECDRKIAGVAGPNSRMNRPNIAPVEVHTLRGGRCARGRLFRGATAAGDSNGVAADEAASDVFIHARHTCDACSRTPIIGTRYHATKIPDFDLCEACYKAYEGEDLAFEPEVLLRDVRMQGRWLKKQLRKLTSRKEIADILEQNREVDPKQPNTPSNEVSNDASEKTDEKEMNGTNDDKERTTDTEHLKTGDASTQAKEEDLEPIAPAPAPFFIHARHTCDGCSRTPIIGTRYKATKIPDFDLCEACYKSYDGEDLDFKPEALDIDTRMQSKWIMHQLAKSARASKGVASLIKSLETSAKAAMASKTHGSCPRDAATSTPEAEDKTMDVKEECVSTQAEKLGDSKESATNTEDNSKIPGSPNSKECNESFLSDAEGHGAIAEVIGRTLDVCVQAMEEVLDDEMDQINNLDKKATVNAVADAYSVGSSMISSVTDILKKMDDCKGSKDVIVSDAPDDVPSTVSGATILKSADDTNVQVEDASIDSDGWSVIAAKKDKEEFAGAAEMIGSLLYNSGVISCVEKGESVEQLSPIVLAKWDEELKQLNELGFTDEHKNVDVLERLEASHVGCDSDEKVTVNAAVEALLGGK